jgi:hypothetical protein
MADLVTPEKFYSAFIKEISASGTQTIPWNNNRKWTKALLKGDGCVMSKIAKDIGLAYCEEYWKLDGIFCEEFMSEDTISGTDIKKWKWARGIKIIVEVENAASTSWKEIWKLIPLFFAPLKVIITYPKNNQEAEKIKCAIKERIKNDDQYNLHRNKIKVLLIFGFKNEKEIIWQNFVYQNNSFKSIKIKQPKT